MILKSEIRIITNRKKRGERGKYELLRHSKYLYRFCINHKYTPSHKNISNVISAANYFRDLLNFWRYSLSTLSFKTATFLLAARLFFDLAWKSYKFNEACITNIKKWESFLLITHSKFHSTYLNNKSNQFTFSPVHFE